eukprot:scaffold6371_cov43-Attheya_sp.AAC.1
MPCSLPSTTCESLHDCTMSSGNRGIPVNVSGVDFKNSIGSYLTGTLICGNKITCWDVSEVTNMDDAFNGFNGFNEPLCWDVASVTTIQRMFQSAYAFSQDLMQWMGCFQHQRHAAYGPECICIRPRPQWMGCFQRHNHAADAMFQSAQTFNGDLSAWDVSNVTNMQAMFQSAQTFNGDLSAWDVSN